MSKKLKLRHWFLDKIHSIKKSGKKIFKGLPNLIFLIPILFVLFPSVGRYHDIEATQVYDFGQSPIDGDAALMFELEYREIDIFIENIRVFPRNLQINTSSLKIADTDLSNITFCLESIPFYSEWPAYGGGVRSRLYDVVLDPAICFSGVNFRDIPLHGWSFTNDYAFASVHGSMNSGGEYVVLSFTPDLFDNYVLENINYEIPIEDFRNFFFPFDYLAIDLGSWPVTISAHWQDEIGVEQTQEIAVDPLVEVMPSEPSAYWDTVWRGDWFRIERSKVTKGLFLVASLSLLASGIFAKRVQDFGNASQLLVANIIGAVAIRQFFLPGIPVGYFAFDAFIMGVVIQNIIVLAIMGNRDGKQR